ncbi:MAG: hypothetical protein BMS9Abin02_1627 [Anaerolineae bacterium]|nr:MAG: hypothetical protein BMS9Abin02_1627 [Anaerolineae bacterium]
MPRRARSVCARVPHHITQRGNRRESVFFTHADRQAYLGRKNRDRFIFSAPARSGSIRTILSRPLFITIREHKGDTSGTLPFNSGIKGTRIASINAQGEPRKHGNLPIAAYFELNYRRKPWQLFVNRPLKPGYSVVIDLQLRLTNSQSANRHSSLAAEIDNPKRTGQMPKSIESGSVDLHYIFTHKFS